VGRLPSSSCERSAGRSPTESGADPRRPAVSDSCDTSLEDAAWSHAVAGRRARATGPSKTASPIDGMECLPIDNESASKMSMGELASAGPWTSRAPRMPRRPSCAPHRANVLDGGIAELLEQDVAALGQFPVESLLDQCLVPVVREAGPEDQTPAAGHAIEVRRRTATDPDRALRVGPEATAIGQVTAVAVGTARRSAIAVRADGRPVAIAVRSRSYRSVDPGLHSRFRCRHLP
jgi:hypothetical protein